MGRVVKVECHSGYTYAEWPVAVTIDKERFEIKKIFYGIKTPIGRTFKVGLEDKREIELSYDENLDEWRMES